MAINGRVEYTNIKSFHMKPEPERFQRQWLTRIFYFDFNNFLATLDSMCEKKCMFQMELKILMIF